MTADALMPAPLTASNLAIHTDSLLDPVAGNLPFVIQYIQQQRDLVIRTLNNPAGFSKHATDGERASVDRSSAGDAEELGSETQFDAKGLKRASCVLEREGETGDITPRKKIVDSMKTKNGRTPPSRSRNSSKRKSDHEHPVSSNKTREMAKNRHGRGTDQGHGKRGKDSTSVSDSGSYISPRGKRPALLNPPAVKRHGTVDGRTSETTSVRNSPARNRGTFHAQAADQSISNFTAEEDQSIVSQPAGPPENIEKKEKEHTAQVKVALKGSQSAEGRKAEKPSKLTKRQGQKRKGLSLATQVMEQFKSTNITHRRLSLKQNREERPTKLGIFNKGRKSERASLRGAFDEQRFLRGSHTNDNHGSREQALISNYFHRDNDQVEESSPVSRNAPGGDIGDGLTWREVAETAKKAMNAVMPPVSAKRNGRRIPDLDEASTGKGGELDANSDLEDLEDVVLNVGELGNLMENRGPLRRSSKQNDKEKSRDPVSRRTRPEGTVEVVIESPRRLKQPKNGAGAGREDLPERVREDVSDEKDEHSRMSAGDSSDGIPGNMRRAADDAEGVDAQKGKAPKKGSAPGKLDPKKLWETIGTGRMIEKNESRASPQDVEPWFSSDSDEHPLSPYVDAGLPQTLEEAFPCTDSHAEFSGGYERQDVSLVSAGPESFGGKIGAPVMDGIHYMDPAYGACGLDSYASGGTTLPFVGGNDASFYSQTYENAMGEVYDAYPSVLGDSSSVPPFAITQSADSFDMEMEELEFDDYDGEINLIRSIGGGELLKLPERVSHDKCLDSQGSGLSSGSFKYRAHRLH
ncbi:hypothetical protein HK104_001646 [Borealophlyctis nickersoniae]|nr:hypothetical protein HK104_001646 [Borealophlyctis nickersoniae]